jgi:hypothetical protein
VLGIKSKESYQDRVRRAVAEDRQNDVAQIAREAFSDDSIGEDVLAWVAAAIYERKIISALSYLHVFVERFPNSLHLIRVYLADVLARSSQYDGATQNARIYLRQAKNAGLLQSLQSHRVAQEGVSRAFLLVTAAYTELGARSYSIRTLEHGLRFSLASGWSEVFENELRRLRQELANAELSAMDKEWEVFFSNGSGADRLHKICQARKFPVLAKRVDLLEGNFRFNDKFEVGDQELFMLVYSMAGNEFILQ